MLDFGLSIACIRMVKETLTVQTTKNARQDTGNVTKILTPNRKKTVLSVCLCQIENPKMLRFQSSKSFFRGDTSVYYLFSVLNGVEPFMIIHPLGLGANLCVQSR